MNRKQRGAATEDDVTGAERGWFNRVRAQPGFRTAFVAFCLTVILGVGAPAAYALWNASVTGMITVQTVKPPLPVITGKLQCDQFLVGVVSMDYTKPVSPMPAGAYVVATVTIPGSEEPKYYAVPNNGSFELKRLPNLRGYIGDIWYSGREITVSVNTAYLDVKPVDLPAEINAASIMPGGTQSTPPATAYYYASFLCNRL